MEQPSIESPLRGEWKVIHNPFDTPYALDFVGLQSDRRLPYPPKAVLAHVFSHLPVATVFGWNRPVYAPFDGTVLDARDGYPDTEKLNLFRDVVRNVIVPPDLNEDIQRFAGNFVVLEGVDGVALLAHLQCGSVPVTSGEHVDAGEQLGMVGNAGASIIPHLHFQLLSRWPSDISKLAELDRPFRFRRFERWSDSEWTTVRHHRPQGRDRIHVA